MGYMWCEDARKRGWFFPFIAKSHCILHTISGLKYHENTNHIRYPFTYATNNLGLVVTQSSFFGFLVVDRYKLGRKYPPPQCYKSSYNANLHYLFKSFDSFIKNKA